MRIAISIFSCRQATTWPERRISRSSLAAGADEAIGGVRRITSAFATSNAPHSINAASTSVERS